MSPTDPHPEDQAAGVHLYAVGGWVRDRLLGEPSSDCDWVAVGATVAQMLALGYKQVGRDFPVFLDPRTGDEVALARTERKSGRGYQGFVVHADPSVTLEEDLQRRDLTINAMAQDAQGRLIDPHGGERDLRAGVLRHVGPAFVEDPLRVLRLARFAARWPHFRVADDTQALLRQMVASGEVLALVPERVWQEWARGLMATQPSRMAQVLHDSGAWPQLLPELLPPSTAGAWAPVDAAATAGHNLAIRHALVPWAKPQGPAQWGQRLRAPQAETDLAHLAQHTRDRAFALAGELVGKLAGKSVAVSAADLAAESAVEGVSTHAPMLAVAQRCLDLLDRCDAWRRPERLADLLVVWQTLSAHAAAPIAPSAWDALRRVWDLGSGVDAGAAASSAMAQGAKGAHIGQAVAHARLQAIHMDLIQTSN